MAHNPASQSVLPRPVLYGILYLRRQDKCKSLPHALFTHRRLAQLIKTVFHEYSENSLQGVKSIHLQRDGGGSQSLELPLRYTAPAQSLGTDDDMTSPLEACTRCMHTPASLQRDHFDESVIMRCMLLLIWSILSLSQLPDILFIISISITDVGSD